MTKKERKITIMQIRTEGIVIKESAVGDYDRYITILTAELGTVEAFVKGARRKGSKLYTSTDLFCYSTFVLFYNQNKYHVDQADINNMFYNIRLDIERLSVASYFCQILYELKPDRDISKTALRLMLNSMHLLANTQKDYRIIKSVFELRILTLSGFSPDVVACRNCGEYQKDMRFYINDGTLLCEACAKNDNDPSTEVGFARLTPGVLAALRHIAYCEPEKVFSFTLDNDNLKLLSEICEAYLIWQTERNYKSLDFLKSLTE